MGSQRVEAAEPQLGQRTFPMRPAAAVPSLSFLPVSLTPFLKVSQSPVCVSRRHHHVTPAEAIILPLHTDTSTDTHKSPPPPPPPLSHTHSFNVD